MSVCVLKMGEESMQSRGDSVAHQVTRFIALTLLFALLNYGGSALYETSAGISTTRHMVGMNLATALAFVVSTALVVSMTRPGRITRM